MNFTKFNKNQFEKIEWSKNTDGFTFKKMSDFYNAGNKKIKVYGFFFTKSDNYGLQPVAICEDCLLNLPTHKRDIISEMLNDKEAVTAIDKGECVIKLREYKSKYNKICYDFDFVDTESENDTKSKTPVFEPKSESNEEAQSALF